MKNLSRYIFIGKNMNMKSSMLLLLVVFVFCQVVSPTKIEAKLRFPQYCAYHSYPTQTHIIPTLDGYNLKFFRLQAKNDKIVPRDKVVYLQHGLQDSSDTWIVNDEHLAPAFLLANKGYDVWVGNIRGNYYSSPQLSPKVKKFWDFSFDEMIKYDLPAAFEYIHNVTKNKIHYVGHSQGTLIMFAALAEGNPVIKSLLASYCALGPVAYLTHQESGLIKTLAHSVFLDSLKSLQIEELFYTEESTKLILSNACAFDPLACNLGLLEISEKNNTVNNLDRLPVVMGHFPSGSSLKNMLHFQQYVRKARFCKYDYGEKTNIQKYGTPEPPVYDLSKIDFPVHLFVGIYDMLADVTDATQLFTEMTNSPLKTFQKFQFGHATFIWGKSTEHIPIISKIIDNS